MKHAITTNFASRRQEIKEQIQSIKAQLFQEKMVLDFSVARMSYLRENLDKETFQQIYIVRRMENLERLLETLERDFVPPR